MLCSFGSWQMVMWAQMCFQVCNTGSQILKWVRRKHQSDGVQTAGKERLWRGEQCVLLAPLGLLCLNPSQMFSLSSCTRLLYLNLKQPMSQSSIHSFLLHPLPTFLLSICAAFPLCSLLSCLRVSSPACCPPPAPPVSICSDEARLCVQPGCGCFTVPLTVSTFHLPPQSRIWVSNRWAAS